MTIEKREELAKFLPRGIKTKLAKEAGVSRSVVTKWLKGEIQNSYIEVFIVKYVERNRAKVNSSVNTVIESKTDNV